MSGREESAVMLRVLVGFLLLVGVSTVRDSFEWFRTKGECRDVITEAGTVRGCIQGGEEHVTFLGVPYAAPPVGLAGRFQPPIRPYSWKGVYEADRIVKCPQKNDGIEDCLVMNIFTPPQLLDGLVPIMVYIHGGSFLIGTGQVQGVDNLVKQNIIVITINYRLGALGFLCLGTDAVPGNAGLKDQIAALQWIQRNIINFGGDPNQVTLYGMSAGGASVELLVLSEQGNGLFQRAIVESGSATTVWAIDPYPIRTALEVAKLLLLPMDKLTNPYIIATLYQRIKAKLLSQQNYKYYETLLDGHFGFAPCIERPTNNSKAFLTELPYDILLKEKYNKVPMMFLFSTVEGLFLRSEEFYKLNYPEKMNQRFIDFVPGDLEFDHEEIKGVIADNIKHFYFGDNNVGDNISDYLHFFGDSLVLRGLLNSAELHSRGGNPVYLMEFAYKGNLGSSDTFYENITLAGHGDVIKHAILNKKVRSKEDKKVVNRVVTLISNFVKFGNPTPERTDLIPILWPTVSPGNVSCLYMDQDGMQIIDEPHWDSKEFWDPLYTKYRKEIEAVDPNVLRR